MLYQRKRRELAQQVGPKTIVDEEVMIRRVKIRYVIISGVVSLKAHEGISFLNGK